MQINNEMTMEITIKNTEWKTPNNLMKCRLQYVNNNPWLECSICSG